MLSDSPQVIGGDVEVDDRNGAARFSSQRVAALNAAREAIVAKAKLLGLVVDKVAETDPQGNALDLAQLAALAREARAARLGDDDVRALAAIAGRAGEPS